MKIAIGADHGGFTYKQILIPFLEQFGHTVEDFGCYSEERMDYPDAAFPVAEAVRDGRAERGILICGTGVGMSISANKVEGIRCALCADPLTAQLTRAHNDSNVLAMGARIIGIELAKNIAEIWLTSAYEGGRHQARLDKISAYETK